MAFDKDLVVVAPDKNTEFFLHGVFSKAHALGMPKVPTYQIDMHPLRDFGCLDADEFLGSQRNRFAYAMVVVADHQQSGEMDIRREDLEADIEHRLALSGWRDRASAVVVDPGISRWLLEHQLNIPWKQGKKPLRRVVEDALRASRMPQSPERYRELGGKIVEEGDPDPAFRKLLGMLGRWFVKSPADSRTMTSAARISRFSILTHEWLEQTRLSSSFDDIVNHPAYRAIIEMGPEVIPLILRDMEREPKHWSTALRELTRANPVRKEHAGQLRKIAGDWIEWAKNNDYVW